MMRPTFPRCPGALAALLAASLGGAAFAQAPASSDPRADGSRLQVTFHLHCFSGVPASERTRLDYWNKGVARGNPDPDCVARKPLLPPVPLRSVSLQHDPESTVELLRLDVDPSAHAAIQAAMLAHQRQVVAVVVQGRIVSVVFLAGSTTDHRIPVYIADKAAAAELESDLRILLGNPR
ncbi:MAG: hypothetical protein ACK515_11905 [bacterium]|jgi:hypothetical protein|nr:hypothetical protein [Betaproteobacteria bacterium]